MPDSKKQKKARAPLEAGQQEEIAAPTVMKIMHSVKACAPWLTTDTGNLACEITHWCTEDDQTLERCMATSRQLWTALTNALHDTD